MCVFDFDQFCTSLHVNVFYFAFGIHKKHTMKKLGGIVRKIKKN